MRTAYRHAGRMIRVMFLLVVGVSLVAIAACPGLAAADPLAGTASAAASSGTFTIEPSASDHGWIDPWTEQTVAAGGSIRFTMGADAGYHIADVLVDDVSVGVRTSYEFTNVQADHSVAVIVSADGSGSFTITPLATVHGWIGPPVPQTVLAGASCRFNIGADPGYRVADVLVDGVSVGARTSYEFTNVRSDHTIGATFEADAAGKFTITPLPSDHGAINPPVPQKVAAGGTCTFSITPDPGYKVADVLVDGVSVGARTTYAFTDVSADHTIGATFEVIPQRSFTITPLPSEHGFIGPPVPQSVPAGGTCLFSVTADPGYHVVDVLVDGSSVGARASYEFRDVQADHTIGAAFAADTGPAVTVTSPGGVETWRTGTTQTVAWTLGSPVSSGRFTVWASAAGGERTQLTSPQTVVAAVSGTSAYQWTGIVDLPGEQSYRIVVRYETGSGEVQSEGAGNWVRVLSGARITVTSPSGTAIWQRGAQKRISWKLNEQAGGGAFRVWAVSARGTRYRVTGAADPVATRPDVKAYALSWRVNVPPGKGYRIVVEHWWAETRLTSARSAGSLRVTR